MERRPNILPKMRASIAEAQVIQRFWESGILGPQARDPASRVNRFMQEAVELGELKEGKPDHEFNAEIERSEPMRRAVGMEAIDSIIIALGVIDSLGLDAQQLFFDKISQNYQKYSLQRRQELIQSGYSVEQTMKIMKDEWNQLHERDEYGNCVPKK